MKFLGKLLYGLVVTLLIAMGSLLFLSLVPAAGIEVKIVKSGSMEPAIETGSIVVVRPAATYGVGDIITFGNDTDNEIPTTHRIVSVRGSGANTFYTTQGDANEERDPEEVPARDVVGTVLFHVPFAGYVLDFARQPLGFALLIGLPAAMIILDESMNIVKEIRALLRRKRMQKNPQQAAAMRASEPPQRPRVVEIPKI